MVDIELLFDPFFGLDEHFDFFFLKKGTTLDTFEAFADENIDKINPKRHAFYIKESPKSILGHFTFR